MLSLRVIAGVARGIPLTAPMGAVTRPTSDRAKESLFNIIGENVKGAMFLDLFSGCGGVGIEAISRGAESCVFVDNSRAAVSSIKANLSKVRLADSAEVLGVSASKAIKQLAASCRIFSIVFLDPPYEGALAKETLDALAASGILSENCLIIVETSSQAPCPALEKSLELVDDRKYGFSRFLFLKLGGVSHRRAVHGAEA